MQDSGQYSTNIKTSGKFGVAGIDLYAQVILIQIVEKIEKQTKFSETFNEINF